MTAVLEEQLKVQQYVMLGCAAVVAFLLVLLVWATGVTISGAIVVPGEVVSDQQQRSVQHPAGGMLAEVLVGEGDIVARGDVLARLDMGQQTVMLEGIEKALLQNEIQRQRLAAAVSGRAELVIRLDQLPVLEGQADLAAALADEERAIFAATRDSMNAQLLQQDRAQAQAAQQVAGLAAQIAALRRKGAVLAPELENQRALVSRGLAPGATVVSMEMEAAQLDVQLSALVSQRSETLRQIEGIGAERAAIRERFRFVAAQELHAASGLAREIEADARQLRLEIAQAVLRAPTDGIVFGMSGQTAFSVLGPGEPLMQIVPLERGHTVLARVGASDVDQVEPGQPVTLRLSALDQRTTPELVGKVSRIAAAPKTDERSGAVFFDIEVHLGPEEQARLPAGVRLLPGMPVETYIRTIDRTPLSYLIKPVRDYFASAFRDG